MKTTEPSFKQFAAAYLAAGAPGASDRERREAESLASGLPFQYLTEDVALKVCIRDLETRKLVDLVYRWAAKPGLVSIVAQRGAEGRSSCVASRRSRPANRRLSTW
jgi:hypothetical protein